MTDEAAYRLLCAALLGHGRLPEHHLRELRSVAQSHAVFALLREQHLQSPSQVDASMATYRQHRDTALLAAAFEARRNRRLEDVVGALATAGVPALIFKGTALAHSHYTRPELRERDDTDLAIDGRHLEAADIILKRCGFEPVPANEGSLIMRQRLYRAHDADGLLHNIDLHWAISNSVRTGRMSIRSLLARSIALPALGVHARMPNAVDALILACAHLDAHHVADVRLVWLYDIHLLVTSMSIDQQQCAVQRALALNTQGACAWVLAAAREAFGTGLDGFALFIDTLNTAPPATHRLRQWQRELSALNNSRDQVLWLWQHLLPSTHFMRTTAGADIPLWRAHLARMRRGWAHLLR